MATGTHPSSSDSFDRTHAMSALLAQNWWAVALRGVFAIIFGAHRLLRARSDDPVPGLVLLRLHAGRRGLRHRRGGPGRLPTTSAGACWSSKASLDIRSASSPSCGRA